MTLAATKNKKKYGLAVEILHLLPDQGREINHASTP
jgi:hypothetical protein